MLRKSDVRELIRRVLREQPEELRIHAPEYPFRAATQLAFIVKKQTFAVPDEESGFFDENFLPKAIWPYVVHLIDTSDSFAYAKKNERITYDYPTDIDNQDDWRGKQIAFTLPGHYYPTRTLVHVSRDSNGIYWIVPAGMKMLDLVLSNAPASNQYTDVLVSDIRNQVGPGYALWLDSNPSAVACKIKGTNVALAQNKRTLAAWLTQDKYIAIQREC